MNMNKPQPTYWTLFKLNDVDHREVNRYLVHKAVTRCVVDDSLTQDDKDRMITSARVLFSVKPTEYGCKIIVQSMTKPDWNKLLPSDADFLGSPVQESAFVRQLEKDHYYEINIDTRACKSSGKQKVFLRDTQEKIDWMTNFLSRRGVSTEMVKCRPLYFTDHKISEGEAPKNIRADSFTVVAKIENPELFQDCLKNGIGRQKMHGLGMIFAKKIQPLESAEMM